MQPADSLRIKDNFPNAIYYFTSSRWVSQLQRHCFFYFEKRHFAFFQSCQGKTAEKEVAYAVAGVSWEYFPFLLILVLVA
jgi:hypothetical protein